LHRNGAEPRRREKILVQFPRAFGRGGPIEARTPAPTAIPVQSELRNYQQGAACLLDVAVHLSFFIGKDPEVEKLVEEVIGVIGVVVLRYS
jgi:hypothetical protein